MDIKEKVAIGIFWVWAAGLAVLLLIDRDSAADTVRVYLQLPLLLAVGATVALGILCGVVIAVRWLADRATCTIKAHWPF